MHVSRDIRVFPANTVMSPEDDSAVLVSTGIASFGMSIAEARNLAQRISRAADDVEHQLAMRERLRRERDDDRTERRTWADMVSDETGIPSRGPL
jgi:hypothetical protein